MKIGFIGLGNVGGKLSGSLIRNGYDVSVLDLNPDRVAEKIGKGAKAGDRKVISSTQVNGKTVHQQVVYVSNGVSFTRHERV